MVGILGVVGFDPVEGVVGGGELVFELEFFDAMEDFCEEGAGGVAEVDEVAAGDEGSWFYDFGGESFTLVFEEMVYFEVAVAGEAVDTVKFEFPGEGLEPEESFEFAFSHFFGVHYPHMSSDAGDDIFSFFVGEFEATADPVGHLGAEDVMVVEADTVGPGEGWRFSDVVEEDREGGYVVGIFQQFEGKAGVFEDVAFGVEFFGLFDSGHLLDFGENMFQEPAFMKEVEGDFGVGAGEHFGELFADALPANFSYFGAELFEGVEGVLFDFKVEAGGEPEGADHPELVFPEALVGIPDCADDFMVDVADALDEIDDFFFDRIVEEAVDGEVAAEHVFFVGGEFDVVGPAAVGV